MNDARQPVGISVNYFVRLDQGEVAGVIDPELATP